MDSIMTFLSNNYIWFLVAAGVFLFALIGLIIESAKKRKKNAPEDVVDAPKEVEAFRNESVPSIEVAEEVPAVEEMTPAVEPVPEMVTEVAPVVEGPTYDAVPTVEPVVAEVQPVMEAPSMVEPLPVEPAPVMDATPVFGAIEMGTPESNDGNGVA